ncbi:MAG: DUF2231 domain-containing protein [Actinomycetota bacterium]|nr:DUF2231 domain-containing protein [Actinomycetota bacterium]
MGGTHQPDGRPGGAAASEPVSGTRARIFSIRPGLAVKGRKFKGLRGWAGKPFHPPLTDFPIVAYVLAAVFDVVSAVAGRGSSVGRDFFVSGTHVIVAGAIVSLGTAATGFWDWWKGVERDRSTGPIGRAKHTQVWRTINWHMAVMLTVTAVVVIDIVVRLVQFDQGYATPLIATLSIAAGVLVGYGSVYGGALVYDYQFNVEGLEGSTAWDETERDQLPSEKPDSDW